MRYQFNLVHFPKGDYPGKLTQREIITEEELSEHFILSERRATRSHKITKDVSFNAQLTEKSLVTELLSCARKRIN